MPLKTYWEPEGYVYECIGIVTAEDIEKINFDFLDIPEGVKPRYQLINGLYCDKMVLDKLDLVNISADDLAVSRKYPNIKVAMVGTNPEFKNVFMDYMQISWAINSSWEFRIFDTLEAAREWLNFPNTGS